MSTKISQDDDVIDSRDVIARIEELEAELQAVHEQETEDGESNLDFEEWLAAIKASANPAWAHETNPDVEELYELRQLQEQAQSSPDWNYGETLINRDYFESYIEELINDCYEMPEGINSGDWPWRHMSIDYAAAANEAEQDYMSVSFFGHEFLIRA